MSLTLENHSSVRFNKLLCFSSFFHYSVVFLKMHTLSKDRAERGKHIQVIFISLYSTQKRKKWWKNNVEHPKPNTKAGLAIFLNTTELLFGERLERRRGRTSSHFYLQWVTRDRNVMLCQDSYHSLLKSLAFTLFLLQLHHKLSIVRQGHPRCSNLQVPSCKLQRCSQPRTPATGNSLPPCLHKPGTQIPCLLLNYIKRGGLSQQEVEEGWHTVSGRHLFCWHNSSRGHCNGHVNILQIISYSGVFHSRGKEQK